MKYYMANYFHDNKLLFLNIFVFMMKYYHIILNVEMVINKYITFVKKKKRIGQTWSETISGKITAKLHHILRKIISRRPNFANSIC